MNEEFRNRYSKYLNELIDFKNIEEDDFETGIIS